CRALVPAAPAPPPRRAAREPRLPHRGRHRGPPGPDERGARHDVPLRDPRPRDRGARPAHDPPRRRDGRGGRLKFAVIALRNLARHRRRSLLSLLVIAAGAVALILTTGFIRFSFDGLREAIIHGGL